MFYKKNGVEINKRNAQIESLSSFSLLNFICMQGWQMHTVSPLLQWLQCTFYTLTWLEVPYLLIYSNHVHHLWHIHRKENYKLYTCHVTNSNYVPVLSGLNKNHNPYLTINTFSKHIQIFLSNKFMCSLEALIIIWHLAYDKPNR